MVKWLLGRLAHTFCVLVLTLTPAAFAADEQQTGDALLHAAFSDIEAIIIALSNEDILTTMGYGTASPAEIPTAFREQITLSRQIVDASYTQLTSRQPQIEAMVQGAPNASLESLVVLGNMFLRTSEAIQNYQTLQSNIDSDLSLPGESRELSTRSIRRGINEIKETLASLQRHMLFTQAGSPSAALFHLRANFLIMQDYAAREAAVLGESITSGKPISRITKGRGDHFGGYNQLAWGNVQSIVNTGILAEAIDDKLEALQTTFFDEFAGTRYYLYDISDFAIEEASDPYNVAVDYERTPEEWFNLIQQANAPVRSLLQSASDLTVQRIAETTAIATAMETRKADAEAMSVVKNVAFLFFIALLLILLIRARRSRSVSAQHTPTPQSFKQEIDVLVQEMNALSHKVNSLAKQHG